MNTIAIIKVSEFRGANARPDKNGLAPMFLTPIAGKIPNRALIQSGTICQREGLEEGGIFLVQINETAANEYGRNFNVVMLDEMRGLELVQTQIALGEAQVVTVTGAPTEGDAEEVQEEVDAADSGLQ